MSHTGTAVDAGIGNIGKTEPTGTCDAVGAMPSITGGIWSANTSNTVCATIPLSGNFVQG